MKGHKLAGESKHAYEIESPDGKRFQVAKHNLDLKMHVAISKMPKAQHLETGGPVLKTGPYVDDGSTAAQLGNAITGGVSAVGSGLQTLGTAIGGNAAPDPAPIPTGVGPTANPNTYNDNLLAAVPTQTSGVPLAAAGNAAPPPDDTPSDSPDAATTTGAPQPSYNPGTLQGSVDAEKAANTGLATAEGKAFDDQAQVYAQHVAALQAGAEAHQKALDAYTARDTDLANQAAAAKIDPNHYMDSIGTGGKILSVIAQAIGGAGAALAGQPNLAAKVISDAIDRDVRAQAENANNIEKQQRLNLEGKSSEERSYQNQVLQKTAVTQGLIQQAAARNGSAIAMAKAQQLNAALQANVEPLKAQLAQQAGQQAYMNATQAGRSTTAGDFDTQRFNNVAALNPKLHEGLAKERGEYEAVTKGLADTDEIFTKAPAKAGYVDRLAPWLPTTQESTKQYHAIVNPFLDKYARDTSGRVNESSLELLKANVPVAGDSPATTAQKRATVENFIKEKANFPLLEQYGIVKPFVTTGQTAGQFK